MEAIRSTTTKYEKHCIRLTSKIKERGYPELFSNEQVAKINSLKWKKERSIEFKSLPRKTECY